MEAASGRPPIWRNPLQPVCGLCARACVRYPRPTNGILLAMTVMNCTFASSGRSAM